MEYKIKLSDEDKMKFDKASALYKDGLLNEALPILEDLSISHPSSPMLKATLANLYWDLKKIDKSIELFNEAIELGPKSEKISRGLFHVLWEQNNENEAVNEIQRFINTGEASKEYIEIALEINSKKDFNIVIPHSESK